MKGREEEEKEVGRFKETGKGFGEGESKTFGQCQTHEDYI